MPWRVLEYAERRWHVSMAAERRPNSPHWNLAFSFRASEPGQRSVWGTYPLSSSSKAALFAQADRVSNDYLVALLTQLLG